MTVKGEAGGQEPAFYVSGLRSGGSILDKATIRCIMEGSAQPQLVNNLKDILVFREVVKEIIYNVRLPIDPCVSCAGFG